MDPLSITSAIVTFWEAGVRLKTSIEKVGRIRQRTRGLLEDVSVLLVAIKDFCDTNSVVLERTASVELSASLDDLKRKLLWVCDRCDHIAPARPTGRLRRLSAGYVLWKQSDDIENELVRLKESMYLWLNRVHVFTAARSELAIAQLAHETLVSLQDTRSHIKQLDDLFCQVICGAESQYVGIHVGHLEQLDDACGQYVRLKLTNICDVLLERPRVLSISPGTFASIPTLQEHMSIQLSNFHPKYEVIPLVQRLSNVWQAMFTGSSSNFPMISIMDLVDDLHKFGLETIVFRCFECFVRDLQCTLRLHTHGPLRKELLLWLQFARWKECELMSMRPWSSEGLFIAEDCLAVSRELYQLPVSDNEAFHFRQHLGDALEWYSVACYHNADIPNALQSAQESLELTIPAYQSGYLRDLRSDVTSFREASIHQDYAGCLFWSAYMQSVTGHYCQARRFGEDGIHIIEDLVKYADSLPPNFYFFDDAYDFLRSHLPTWVNIVPNPEFLVNGRQDDEGPDSDGNRYIEWGVAI